MSPGRTWFKIWFIILASVLMFIFFGYQIGGRLGLFLSFGLGLVFIGILFVYGEGRLLQTLPLERMLGQDPWGVSFYLKKLCDKIEIAEPKVYVADLELPTCFCIGYTSQNATLCVSRGLLDKLNESELEAIMASQLVYLKKMMSRTSFGIMSILTNSLLGLANSLDKLLHLPFIFLTVVSPIGWLLLKFSVRPKIFTDNDLLATQLILNRKQLGEALWRLHGLTLAYPYSPPPCTKHLFILDPSGDKKRSRFLNYHPAVEVRMRNILGYYPI